jgi:hypothetical protein
MVRHRGAQSALPASAATGNRICEAQFARHGLGWRTVEMAVISSPYEYHRWTDEYETLSTVSYCAGMWRRNGSS